MKSVLTDSFEDRLTVIVGKSDGLDRPAEAMLLEESDGVCRRLAEQLRNLFYLDRASLIVSSDNPKGLSLPWVVSAHGG